jgi:hypothetical protein
LPRGPSLSARQRSNQQLRPRDNHKVCGCGFEASGVGGSCRGREPRTWASQKSSSLSDASAACLACSHALAAVPLATLPILTCTRNRQSATAGGGPAQGVHCVCLIGILCCLQAFALAI